MSAAIIHVIFPAKGNRILKNMDYMNNFGILDISIVATYMIGVLFLGVYRSFKTKTVAEYAIGSKKFSLPILVATITATALGASTTIGLAEKGFTLGIVFIAIFLGDVISKLTISKYIACQFDKFSGMISVGEIMRSFYGKQGQIITGIGGTLLSIGYVAAQISATGFIFEYFLNIPYVYGAFIGVGVTIVYSALGGIRGVALTDVVQFAVLIIAIPVVLNIAISTFPSWQDLIDDIPAERFDFFPSGTPAINYISLFIIFCLPILSPAMVQRLLMAKNAKEARLSMKVSAFVEIPFIIIAGSIGIVAYAINSHVSPHIALPHLINTMLPLGVKGLAVAGILAVIMSSADSYLNAAGITFVHDVIKPLRKRFLSEKHELHLNMVITMLLGFSTLFISLYLKNVVDIIVHFFNFWGPVVLVPLVAGILGFTISKKQFFICAFSGFFTFVTWTLFDLKSFFVVDHTLPALMANFGLFFYFLLKKNKTLLDFDVKRLLDLHYQNLLAWWDRQFSSMDSEPPYIAFGVFCTINYNIPYYMWSTQTPSFNNLLLRVIASIFCFFLIIKDYWPTNLRPYLKCYWLFAVWFCLPFFTTYSTLLSHGAPEWLINSQIMLFFLTVLTNWVVFFLILFSGVILGYAAYSLTCGYAAAPIELQDLLSYQTIYMYIFAILIGLLFAKRREQLARKKYDEIQLLSGAIAHEMRTPLSSIGSVARGIERYLPTLITCYKKNTQNEETPPIPSKHLKKIEQAAASLNVTVRQTQNIIDMLLVKVKNLPQEAQWSNVSINECLRSSIQEYPFSKKEKSILCYKENPQDFIFKGDIELMHHVFFNLFKNAFYHVLASGKDNPKVEVFTTETVTLFQVHIKDNGHGIPSAQRAKIFQRFSSARNGGTGIGLAFCRDVIESFGGYIDFDSKENLYTDFVITLPKKIT